MEILAVKELEPQPLPPPELHPRGYYTGTITGIPNRKAWAKIIADIEQDVLGAPDALEKRERF